MSEFQPLNVIESSDSSSRKSSSGYSSRSSSGNKMKPSKRSRTNSPNWDEQNDLSDGASSRQRRKSNSGVNATSETKRRDSIKTGLEELQRALPQFTDEEKVWKDKRNVSLWNAPWKWKLILISDKPSNDIIWGSQVSQVLKKCARWRWHQFRHHAAKHRAT